jgi:uncharacterized membrane protein
MFKGVLKPALVIFRKVTTSIAFVPGVIALAMLSLSIVMIEFDFSSTGKSIKSNLPWLTLRDASTARIICSTIAGGIFSLTVFSFSMVMILLSQAAAQMSNRILGKLIRNRFQQVVLGFYIGTILYALFLLSTIRDTDTGVHVPAISAYLLICLTIVDIFLFIYFLHYVTESVKFDTIIYRIFKDTDKGLKAACVVKANNPVTFPTVEGHVVKAFKSGAFEGFDKQRLLALCKAHEMTVIMSIPTGAYLICGVIDIGRTQDVTTSYFYGFKQLMEIGIKALSPGINDPGTCILSIQALAELLAFRLIHSPETKIYDEAGKIRIITADKTFDEIFNDHMLPIWDYGKNDRLVNHELVHILHQLQSVGSSVAVDNLLKKCKSSIAENFKNS